MNFRSWQRWQLIEYALLQKISEEKAVENGKTLPQTKQEYAYALITDSNGNSVTNTEFNISSILYEISELFSNEENRKSLITFFNIFC